jgi:hypothetical protein
MKVPTIICPKCDGEIDALAFQEWGHGRHPLDCPVAPNRSKIELSLVA